MLPTILDRAQQALHLLALDPVAETISDPNSYGFRPDRSPADAIEQCFRVLAKKNAPQWILEGDIKSCFDEISHNWLLAKVPMDKGILQQWLKAGFMEHQRIHPTEAGTPQGGICSPVLANLALNGLERRLKEAYPRTTEKGKRALVNVVRYADDFIVTGRSKELLEQEVKPLVEAFMHERGLTLSAEKTTTTHIDDGFDFLGQNIRKYHGKLLIKPAQKKVKAFLREVRAIIKANKQIAAGQLIDKLNPVIRGWVNYHQHVVSKQTFSRIDWAIFRALWRWAKRRHPAKPRNWIKKKYFCSKEGRDWIFHGKIIGKNGVIRDIQLYYAAQTPISRHRKIRGKANPYDPAWELYFEERLGVKMASDLKGRRSLLYLWKEQNGLCPICHQKITKLTGWHSHHIVWRAKGGPDKAENRVLLHPNCHEQVHSQGWYVEKPRPVKRTLERLEPGCGETRPSGSLLKSGPPSAPHPACARGWSST